MTNQATGREAGEKFASSRGHAKAKRAYRVIPGTLTGGSDEKRQPKIRVVERHEGNRLTTEQWKQQFARNLDRLLRLVGLSRKVAAEEIGVPYTSLRRLVSAGVSRSDERSAHDLKRIATYFLLPNVDAFWRADLLPLVLTTDEGRGFVEKFRSRLLTERESRLAEASLPCYDELALLGRALGFEHVDLPPLSRPYAAKVAAILASPRAGQFKRLIDDYHELVAQRSAGVC